MCRFGVVTGHTSSLGSDDVAVPWSNGLAGFDHREDDVDAVSSGTGGLIESTSERGLWAMDPRRVDERHVLEDAARRVAAGALEAREERVAERREPGPGERRVDRQRRAGRPPVLQGVRDGDDAVRRGLGADVGSRVLAAEQVLDEGRFSGAVLPEQQHGGLGVEVGLGQAGREEGAELVGLLDGLDCVRVCLRKEF